MLERDSCSAFLGETKFFESSSHFMSLMIFAPTHRALNLAFSADTLVLSMNHLGNYQ